MNDTHTKQPCKQIQYFFCYKTEFFFIENNRKNGSRSLGFFRKGKTRIIAKFRRTGLVICSHAREGKSRLTV